MRPILFFLFAIIAIPLFSQTRNSSDTIVHISEKMKIEASVIGDDKAWIKYLETYMNFTVPYDNGAPIGKYTVIIQFIIDKNGTVSDVKALTNFGYGMEEEGVRLIKNGPKWTPAMERGVYVKSSRNQPVTFVVSGDGIEINSETPYILFKGIKNIVTIKADSLNDKDIEVIISQGSIVSIGNGKYKALVNNPRNAIITVLTSGGKNKLGSAYFIVNSKQPLKN